MTDDLVFIKDILERIQRIEAYTKDGKEEFFQSLLIQDGVIRSFEVIGEAVKLLSMELRQNYSEIPWRRIAGFRDVLIHDYMGIDLVEVWNVVELNLPNLKEKLLAILQELENET
ncbi:DUF86 domain-containing protein [Cronbergia sp. UHCC 0137]|uniref:HepT-like ribonuclease domain-containing protein n=1 Tax=Cronbergia sp. UHCC 0137 TaxID=3110239 RepID=UPI002B1F68F1|nr:DUF86 domain-containing protein [Cronbergia sp. UHCC 0137]MEA5617429.1 DUF86 domain-containing protein [Cronbergia sp. UHCC 0137]